MNALEVTRAHVSYGDSRIIEDVEPAYRRKRVRGIDGSERHGQDYFDESFDWLVAVR